MGNVGMRLDQRVANRSPGGSVLSGAKAAGRLTVLLGAVAENYRRLETMTGDAVTLGAVVKADAYGLGAVPVARRLVAEGCRVFFVAHPGEGADLRDRAAVPAEVPVYLLNGLCGEDPAAVLAAGLTPVLNSLEEIARWSTLAKASARALPAVLQIDTGISRTGLPPAEADRLAAQPDLLAGLELEAVMSHLACADEPDHPMNARQRSLFLAASTRLPKAPMSLANSCGVFLGRDYHFDLVRPGQALYGLNPFPAAPNPMLPAVRLEAEVLQVRTIGRGESVGYGASFVAEGTTRIATLGVGYADGYFRALSNRGDVAFGGFRAPIAGRVSMDLVTVDVTKLPESLAHAGAYAELIGATISADEVGITAGSLGYEVLTNLGPRYARDYRDGP